MQILYLGIVRQIKAPDLIYAIRLFNAPVGQTGKQTTSGSGACRAGQSDSRSTQQHGAVM